MVMDTEQAIEAQDQASGKQSRGGNPTKSEKLRLEVGHERNRSEAEPDQKRNCG